MMLNGNVRLLLGIQKSLKQGSTGLLNRSVCIVELLAPERLDSLGFLRS